MLHRVVIGENGWSGFYPATERVIASGAGAMVGAVGGVEEEEEEKEKMEEGSKEGEGKEK
jgi:hypothetical protein